MMQRFRIEWLNAVIVFGSSKLMIIQISELRERERIIIKKGKFDTKTHADRLYLHCYPIVQCVARSSMFSRRNSRNHSAIAFAIVVATVIDGPAVEHFLLPSKRIPAFPYWLCYHCCTYSTQKLLATTSTVMYTSKQF